jgi:hypothetical protein
MSTCSAYLISDQALIAQLNDLVCGGGMGRRSARTHGDASTAKLMPHGSPGNAQLGADLAQGQAVGVQVGCTFHGATPCDGRIAPSRCAATGYTQC